ncbi:choice-of-anchor Q domain-containing protein, partial [Massilia glaciei]
TGGFRSGTNYDANTTGYKLVATNNTVTGARNLFPCNCFGFQQPTDGNGTIIDSFNKFAYTGKTLVANNIVHDNGGRGIHALNANYLDVFNNTAYRNSTIKITGDGEITLQRTRFVRVWNNIMVASPDRPANLYTLSSDGDFSHNIVFGGNRFTPTPGGVNNRLATDPLFTATSGPFAFQLAPNSPAVNSVHNEGVPGVDVYGAPRPRGQGADVGAVESF